MNRAEARTVAVDVTLAALRERQDGASSGAKAASAAIAPLLPKGLTHEQADTLATLMSAFAWLSAYVVTQGRTETDAALFLEILATTLAQDVTPIGVTKNGR